MDWTTLCIKAAESMEQASAATWDDLKTAVMRQAGQGDDFDAVAEEFWTKLVEGYAFPIYAQFLVEIIKREAYRASLDGGPPWPDPYLGTRWEGVSFTDWVGNTLTEFLWDGHQWRDTGFAGELSESVWDADSVWWDLLKNFTTSWDGRTAENWEQDVIQQLKDRVPEEVLRVQQLAPQPLSSEQLQALDDVLMARIEYFHNEAEAWDTVYAKNYLDWCGVTFAPQSERFYVEKPKPENISLQPEIDFIASETRIDFSPAPLTAEIPAIPERPEYGEEYSVLLQADGGVPPYTWRVIGRLPDGLRLENGTICGTPTAVRGKEKLARSFGLRVRDSSLPKPQTLRLDQEFAVFLPSAPRPKLTLLDEPDASIRWLDSLNTGDFHVRMTRPRLDALGNEVAKAVQKVERSVLEELWDRVPGSAFDKKTLTARVNEDVEVVLVTEPVPPGEREAPAQLHAYVALDANKLSRKGKEAVDSAALGSRVDVLWFPSRFFVVKGTVSDIAYKILAEIAGADGKAYVRRTKNFSRQSTYKVSAMQSSDALIGRLQQAWRGARVQEDQSA